MSELDPRLQKAIDKVTGKRPRTVIDHILEHGHITTEEIAAYGYEHPPRAARDVREAGVPLETFRVKSSEGKSIGAYRFGDPSKIEEHKLAGRQVFPKELLDSLYLASGGRCLVCAHSYEKRYLQIDHRIPYEIAGEMAAVSDEGAFMLLCGTCQRKKSWSCEHCRNWADKKDGICRMCYWASPASYSHVALEEVRRVDLVFSGEDATIYDKYIDQNIFEEKHVKEAIIKLVIDAVKGTTRGGVDGLD
ncbi:HNH endonuclease signature motif containing protein [Gemmatimonadota bacterium]